ncbi:MAG: cytochrome c [Anaerolineales bacterium]|jgi:mono/diheme cytochrome c family protein
MHINLQNSSTTNIHKKGKFHQKLPALLLILIFTIFVAACDLSLASDITPPPDFQAAGESAPITDAEKDMLFPLVPPEAENGETIYQEKCAPCHGATGLGNGPRAGDLPNPVIPIGTAEVARTSTPADWYTVVTKGNLERFMPPFESLSSRQRWDVIAYTYNLSTPPESIAVGKALYDSMCTDCHGKSGKGDGEKAGNFSVPPSDLTDLEYNASKSSADFYQAIVEGIQPDMPAFGDQLSEDDRWNIADYIRSLAFKPLSANEEISLESQSPDAESAPQVNQIETTEQSGMDASSLLMSNVRGEVYNLSGGNVPEGLMVTLHGFDHFEPVFTTTTTLQEDLTYAFQDIELTEGFIYFTTVDYDGAVFGSPVSIIEPGIEELDLPIEIFETTSDSSGLVVDRLHYFIDQIDPQTLRIAELFIISNPGEKSIIPDESSGTTIEFELPAKSTNLELLDGEIGDRFVKTEKGFGDTFQIRPGFGEVQIMFAYDLPFDGDLELVRPVNLLTNAVVILVPEDGIQIKASGISDGGTRDVEGIPYHTYNLGPTMPGEDINLRISKSMSLSDLDSLLGNSTTTYLGFAVLGLVLIVSGVWLYRHSRAEPKNGEVAEQDLPEDYKNGIDDRESAMDAILALDDHYKEGLLPEEAYQKRRAELKAHLKEIIDREKAQDKG